MKHMYIERQQSDMYLQEEGRIHNEKQNMYVAILAIQL